MSWGQVLGKVFDWIPNKKEHLRNKIQSLERKIDEIQAEPYTSSNRAKYVMLTDELQKARQQLENL